MNNKYVQLRCPKIPLCSVCVHSFQSPLTIDHSVTSMVCILQNAVVSGSHSVWPFMADCFMA